MLCYFFSCKLDTRSPPKNVISPFGSSFIFLCTFCSLFSNVSVTPSHIFPVLSLFERLGSVCYLNFSQIVPEQQSEDPSFEFRRLHSHFCLSNPTHRRFILCSMVLHLKIHRDLTNSLYKKRKKHQDGCPGCVGLSYGLLGSSLHSF